MPPALTTTLNRLKGVVNGFTVAQRTIAIIGVAALALGTIALSSWLSKPTLTPLFTGLAADDASAIVEQLDASAVDYELTDGGSTILVPKDDVYAQRLEAAAAGLPAGGADGYNLLDKMGVTSSEFQQSVTYKRAIEGELASTISAMKGIQHATVQLAIPEESVFVSETQDPTASVFIETGNGVTLNAQQVEAIVHLTSAAVPGMKPESVAIIDHNGNTLSAIGTGVGGNAGQQASEYEERVAANVQQLLDKVVGPGNATVQVAAEHTSSTSERLEESYAPPEEGTPATSEKTTSETYGGGQLEAGVLGTERVETDENGSYEKLDTSRNNAVNRTVESTATPAGQLSRQTVAVAVSSTVEDDVTVGQIEALVASSAGINDDRGDEVTVEFVPFNDDSAQAAEEALEAARQAEQDERDAQMRQTMILAGAIAVPLLLGLILWIVLARIRSRKVADAENILTEDLNDSFLLDGFDAAHSADAADTVVLDAPPAHATSIPNVTYTEASMDAGFEPDQVQITMDRRRAEVSDYARRHPQRTAELLRDIIRNGTN